MSYFALEAICFRICISYSSELYVLLCAKTFKRVYACAISTPLEGISTPYLRIIKQYFVLGWVMNLAMQIVEYSTLLLIVE